MNNPFGIYDKSYRLITEALSEQSEINKVYIFGSRAMGNYKKGSDIDLAVVGDKVDTRLISGLSAKINESLPIPYRVDILNFNSIDNKNLKEHILTEGKLFWQC